MEKKVIIAGLLSAALALPVQGGEGAGKDSQDGVSVSRKTTFAKVVPVPKAQKASISSFCDPKINPYTVEIFTQEGKDMFSMAPKGKDVLMMKTVSGIELVQNMIRMKMEVCIEGKIPESELQKTIRIFNEWLQSVFGTNIQFFLQKPIPTRNVAPEVAQ